MKNIFIFINGKKLKYGAFATGFTIIFIAAIVIINMIVGLVNSKFPLKVDLTANKVFSLDAQSVKLVKGITKPVTIYILAPSQSEFISYANSYFASGNVNAGNNFEQSMEIINQYPKNSKNVSIKYIDINKDPTFAAKYPDLDLKSASILITSGEKSSTLAVADLVNLSEDQTSIYSSKAEYEVSSAILNVTQKVSPIVTILEGNGEQPTLGLQTALKKNGYVVKSQSLLVGSIDPLSNFLVIAGMTKDFTEVQTKQLDTFLRNNDKYGKGILYFASPEQPVLPVLDAFLAEWGIQVMSGVVYETDQNKYYQSPLITTVDYLEKDFAGNLANTNTISFAPYSRPLKALFDAKSNYKTTKLLGFSDKAVAMPADAANDWDPTKAEVKGPFEAMILSKKTQYEGTTPQESYILACGSIAFIDQSLLSTASYGNSQYIMGTINTLVGKKEEVVISAKTISGDAFTMNASVVVFLAILFVGVLPIAVLITGIVVWRRRRYL